MVRKICNVLISVILVGVIILVVLLGVPLVGGKKLFVVTTGSMMQAYPINTVVVVEATAPAQIIVGDDITFHGAQPGTVITHRVIDINPQESYFTTQGTNNNRPDPPIPFISLVGRVTRSIPYVGVLANLLQSISGKILAGCFLILVVLLLLLPELFNEQEDEDRQIPPPRGRKKVGHFARKAAPLEHYENHREPLQQSLEEGLMGPERVTDFTPEPQPDTTRATPFTPPPPQYDDSSPFDNFPPFLPESDTSRE